ncbi:hypothetical protein SASPL_120818 [Salvia splendens]|uniref:U6 snRNA-associated Sm-like protein LSm8 n=1 Tax=Salvia splendens TaxID=180675 RepID=A0A8X8XTS5_SALSN|nr:hypothetical protein SASPL_120818 [Salvia splendens]
MYNAISLSCSKIEIGHWTLLQAFLHPPIHETSNVRGSCPSMRPTPSPPMDDQRNAYSLACKILINFPLLTSNVNSAASTASISAAAALKPQKVVALFAAQTCHTTPSAAADCYFRVHLASIFSGARELIFLLFVEYQKMATGAGLETLVDQTISIITNDGRNIVGILKGFDQATNIILDESHERVYSTKVSSLASIECLNVC